MSRYTEPAAPRQRGKHHVLREVSGLLGELLITAGALCLLFVVWQLWWTDVVSDADAAQVVTAMENTAAGSPAGDQTRAWVHPEEIKLGDAFAIVRIPRFGENFARPLYEGTTRSILQRGIGHYAETALPGEIGNFSMAGHRTTYGKPFNKIAELVPGDKVIVETVDTYFVYTITDHEIVVPTAVQVVLPVPNEPDAAPTKALVTMTSCHPEFSSRERYVQHGVLEASYPRAGGLPADVLEVSER